MSVGTLTVEKDVNCQLSLLMQPDKSKLKPSKLPMAPALADPMPDNEGVVREARSS